MEKVSETTFQDLRIEQTNETTAKKKPTIKLAAWWKRLLSLLIDLFFISIIFNITIQLVTGYDVFSIINKSSGYYNYRYYDDEDLKTLRLFTRFGILITMFLYYLFFEITLARTMGKLFTGTIVMNLEDNKKASVDRVISRTFCRFIPFEIFSFLSKYPYGWHDKLSNTFVTTVKEKRFFETGRHRIAVTTKFVNYFFNDVLNKGFQRILIAGSFILPVLIGYVSYQESGQLIEGYEDRYGYYDEGAFYAGLIVGIIGYWVIYLLVVWIYKGFKESKQSSS
jgi:uncharacterized RDD family membrane protein YckC